MARSRIGEVWSRVRDLASRSPRLPRYLETRRSLSRDAIIDCSDDMIAAQDDAFRYIYFNDAYRIEFKTLWGVDLKLGASMIELLAAWPDDLQNAKHLWSRALGGESFIDTVRFGPGDPSSVYELRFHPIFDGAGRRLGAAHIVRNVNERFEKERRMRVRERRADLLARLSDATRALTDAHEICRAAMRLLREALDADRCIWADVEGDEDHFTFIGVEVRPGVPTVSGRYPVSAMGADALQKMRAGLAFICSDAQSELPEGAARAAYVETGVRAVLSTPLHKAGRFVAGTGVHMSTARQWTAEEIDLARAVTERCGESIERARAEKKLREADRSKDEFLASLARQLRGPLAPLRNGLNVLETSETQEERVRIYGIMNSQLERFTALIDDLADISNIAQGQIKLKRVRTELATTIGNAVNRCEPRRGQRQLALRLPQQPIYLNADATRLTQVIANVLDNAYRATAATGQVSLSVAVDGTSATICVRDDGAGIADENLERIFDMFLPAGTNGSDASGPLGIGLGLARRLVELHGGTLSAHSNGPGSGSEFVVRLRTSSETDGAPDGVTQPAPTRRLRVLIVDDNREAAWSASTLLALWGHDVEVAFDGATAVEKALQQETELMLLDLGMPEVDGYEVCRTLRALPWADGMAIVALTGWGQAEDRTRTFEAGFDAHLVKPINDKALLGLLEKPGQIWSRVGRRTSGHRTNKLQADDSAQI